MERKEGESIQMEKESFLKRYGLLIATGLVVGAAAVLLTYFGNPANMGFCIACFLRDIAGALNFQRAGFDAATCDASVQSLLNRGGMNSIMSTTLLVFCAFCFAGIMSKAGCLDVVLQKILSVAKSTGSLILATVVSCITMALTTGNSYLSILIPGEMFRDAYRERGLAAKNLSRTLEDVGTCAAAVVPWCSSAMFYVETLGVPVWGSGGFAPYTVLPFLCPIIAFLLAWTGICISKLSPEEIAEELKEITEEEEEAFLE